MKKSLQMFLASVMLSAAATNMGNAQTQIALENFNRGIPNTWTIVDGDGQTPKLSTIFRKAWVAYLWESDRVKGADSLVLSTSDYNTTNPANDWLITPAISLTGTKPYLVWQDIAYNPNKADGYKVLISTSTADTADFTDTLLLVTAASGTYSTITGLYYKSVDLSAYAGQTVHIAFVNNSQQKYVLGLDNIGVFDVEDGMLDVKKVEVPQFVYTDVDVTAIIQNKGADPITTATLSYSIDGGPAVTQTFTGLNITTFNSAVVTFNQKIQVAGQTKGAHNIEVSMVSFNGSGSASSQPSANTTFTIPSNQETFNCLMEQFTSSTCPPCVTFNNSFDPIIKAQKVNEATSNFNIIRYQMNWPSPGNDKSYNNDGAIRRGYYGVNSIPYHATNGHEGGNGNNAEITECKQGISPIKISGDYTVYTSGGADSLVVSLDINPYFTDSTGNFKLFVALIEDFYNYPDAYLSYKNFIHVMRKMLPNANGTTISKFETETPQNFRFKYNYALGNVTQGTYRFWDHPSKGNAVVFIQNVVTGDILQSQVIRAQFPLGVEDLNKGLSELLIAPNPAADFTTLYMNVEKPQNISYQIYDMAGRVVAYKDLGLLSAGENHVNISTESFTTGLYLVKISTEQGVITKSLNITK